MAVTTGINAVSDRSHFETTASARIGLIVNADDFGRSDGVNAGVLHAHRHGIVRSASLMVRWPAAREALAMSNECPHLSLGLHLDLGEWKYDGGQWSTVYDVVALDDAERIADEIDRQVELFQDLAGRNPTHLDSHQHVHRNPPVHRLVSETAQHLDVPLRHFNPAIRYCGDFYGQSNTGESRAENVSVHALVTILAQLEPGLHELSCHPATDVDFDTMYRDERMLELKSLCDERVRSAIDRRGIELLSYSNCRGRQFDSQNAPLLDATSKGGRST